MILLVEMNGSRHEARSSAAISTENHLDSKKLPNPEPEKKINGSQADESIKVPNPEPEKKINGSQVDERGLKIKKMARCLY